MLSPRFLFEFLGAADLGSFCIHYSSDFVIRLGSLVISSFFVSKLIVYRSEFILISWSYLGIDDGLFELISWFDCNETYLRFSFKGFSYEICFSICNLSKTE